MAEESRPAGAEAQGDAGTGESAAPPGGAAAEGATDLWGAFDPVLQAFMVERRVALGTLWGESTETIGRFASWANAAGWRCTLQLVHAPEENVVVLLVVGPPLPGGRTRALPLGPFPLESEPDVLRGALELGYGIAETWGPAHEPPPPQPPPAEPGAAPSESTPPGTTDGPTGGAGKE